MSRNSCRSSTPTLRRSSQTRSTLGNSGLRLLMTVGPATRASPFRSLSDLYIAGFVCKARSRLNSKASQNKGCVQAGAASTGKSFRSVAEYIKKHRPAGVVLENLQTLLESGEEGALPDSDYITQFLQCLGYLAQAFFMDARSYGSIPRRERVFWVAILSEDPSKLELVVEIIESTRT